MSVKRVGYVGVRTSDVGAMTRFFRDVVGLEDAGEKETVTFQRLPTHRADLVEVYATDHDDTRMIPEGVDFMVGFVVDDIRGALAKVEKAGLELIGDPVWAAEAFDNPSYGDLAWFFVRAPDGRVYVLEQVPD
jgi:hypothetical protein